MNEIQKLRELAAWYREFAERAGAPWIWEGRLHKAKLLEEEADRLEKHLIRCADNSAARDGKEPGYWRSKEAAD